MLELGSGILVANARTQAKREIERLPHLVRIVCSINKGGKLRLPNLADPKLSQLN